MRKTTIALLALTLVCSALSAQQSSVPSEKVTFEPLGGVRVRPGHPAPVRFVFHVKSGFHINSHKPTMPELIPTVMHFSLPDDVVIGGMEYPTGELMSFPFDPTTRLSVYSGDVVITGRLVAPPTAARGTYTVHADLKYQACDNNACYPPKTLPITFNVTVGAGSTGARRAHGNAQSPHIHN